MWHAASDGHSGTGEIAGREAHAVVIGGSIAGLLAARVLADHFGQVTIVERDHLAPGPTPRKGVPQARHVHALLVGGYRLLNRLFPGLEAELVAAGAPRVDWTAGVASLLLGGWSPRYGSDLVTHTCSRALLEDLIRRRLAANHRVCLLDQHEAIGLLHDEKTVTGVRVTPHPAGAAEPRELHADLVVDAAGRNSRTPQWLEGLGYSRPQETVIDAFLGYATRWYRRPPDFPSDWRVLVMVNTPPHNRRGGVIYPVEGGQWIVTLGGIARDYPPTDEAGFLRFASTLRSPLLHEAIKDAQPLTPIHGYQRTDNCLRHYERLPRRPEGFVVLGDAVCAFNPVYGQGMTVAALGASGLDRMLREHLSAGSLAGLPHRFQQHLAGVIKVPWLMATGEDLRWPTTEGDRPQMGPADRLLQWYFDRMLMVIPRSAAVHKGFCEVVHLVEPPSRLFHPGMVLRVAGHSMRPRSRLGTRPPPAPPCPAASD